MYDDPRGGRPSGLEGNVLRYRAAEAALYLFYAERVRGFLLDAADPRSPAVLARREEQRLRGILADLLREAESAGKLPEKDAAALRREATIGRRGRGLRDALKHATMIGILSEAEAGELRALLDYRNVIAHEIHAVMSDLSRHAWVGEWVARSGPAYRGQALERLRAFRRLLPERARGKLMLALSLRDGLFEFAERAYGREMERLERLIGKQISREHERLSAISAELDLRGTGLVGDLSPRFPANHRPDREGYGDEIIPATGHLTKRGAEICYRLFDLGKSPMAVAYLMGMTLRSAERRRRGWVRAGGSGRVRAGVERYDHEPM